MSIMSFIQTCWIIHENSYLGKNLFRKYLRSSKCTIKQIRIEENSSVRDQRDEKYSRGDPSHESIDLVRTNGVEELNFFLNAPLSQFATWHIVQKELGLKVYNVNTLKAS